MRRVGIRSVAVLVVGVLVMALASVADAAVVRKKPASAYQANGTVRVTLVVGGTTYLGGQFTAMVPAVAARP